MPDLYVFEDTPADHQARRVARRFHDWYEHWAPHFGYETRPESGQADDLPENLRKLMECTVLHVITDPGGVLCWAENEHHVACDRMARHNGPCSWTLEGESGVALVARLPEGGDHG